LRQRTMYLLTLLSPMSMPSLSSPALRLLACRRRRTTLPLCFQLLGAAQEALTEEHTSSTEDVLDLYRCPKCGDQ
jgi:hypothetical protein